MKTLNHARKKNKDHYSKPGSVKYNKPYPGFVKRADGGVGCPYVKFVLLPDHTGGTRKFHSGIGTKGRTAYTRMSGDWSIEQHW